MRTEHLIWRETRKLVWTKSWGARRIVLETGRDASPAENLGFVLKIGFPGNERKRSHLKKAAAEEESPLLQGWRWGRSTTFERFQKYPSRFFFPFVGLLVGGIAYCTHDGDLAAIWNGISLSAVHHNSCMMDSASNFGSEKAEIPKQQQKEGGIKREVRRFFRHNKKCGRAAGVFRPVLMTPGGDSDLVSPKYDELLLSRLLLQLDPVTNH
ncbi:hypothetical protein CEXT_595751 [Caerostris extrusa]|uniref:Uncharacterized protein n=1 Tax=Caerostris extrusa TaxID=172846 RepID=A0AAV4XYV2_CAEEX|nr:hypothetical protein CEXT_595751 [Caerostris extrusa]